MRPWLPLVLLPAALLAGCASQPKEPPRIVMQGFSLSAPNVKDWIVAKQGPELTIIGKEGRFSGETFTMQATVVKLQKFGSIDDLLRHVEDAERKELDPKRFRVFKLDVKPYQVEGQTCAHSNVEAAERATSGTTGSPVNVMLETVALVCPHPEDATRGINMTYSHRHFPEDVDPQFAQDGALLLQTLRFEHL